MLKRFGYSDKRGCGKAELCPAFSLPDLFRSGPNATPAADRRALLDAVPPYFSQGVITADRRTATLAFGIRLMPLDRQQQRDRRHARPPAPARRASRASSPACRCSPPRPTPAVSSPWRRLLTLLAGLAAVALVLLAVFRALERALVPLVPIALATGWSALVLFALRIPLNPMSVTLGALVIAISTEFSVLLSERYREERAAGHEPGEALGRTYRSTGAAVLASGMTAIAGFAVLVVSDIRMLRDFGFVTVVDLTVSLLGVLVVLPAVLVLAERGALRLPRRRAAAAARRSRRRSARRRREQRPAYRRLARRRQPLRVVRVVVGVRARSPTSRSTRCAPRRRRAGLADGEPSCRRSPRRWRSDRSTATPTSRASRPGRGRPAPGLRGARRRASSTRASSAERGPVVLAFLATRGDAVHARARRARARAAAPSRACSSPRSSIRGDRGDLRALVRRHGWRFPVGLGPRRRPGQPLRRRGLPAADLVLPGGVVQATSVGELDGAALDARARARSSARRARGGWRP